MCRSVCHLPLYFFDIHDGRTLMRDSEGSTLHDLPAAQLEATDTLTQMARELFPGGGDKEISIDIRDIAGNALMHVALKLSASRVS